LVTLNKQEFHGGTHKVYFPPAQTVSPTDTVFIRYTNLRRKSWNEKMTWKT